MRTPKELAHELGVSPMWVMRRIRGEVKDDIIKAERRGWVWLIPQGEFDRVKEKHAAILCEAS